MSANSTLASDVGLLRNLNGIVHLDAEVANSALDRRVPEQRLDGAQIGGSPVDQHRLRTSQRVSPELGWIEPDAGNPFVYKSGVLLRRQSMWTVAATGEKELAGLPSSQSQVIWLTKRLRRSAPRRFQEDSDKRLSFG